MTTGDKIEQQSFCYDPDFPPDIAEGEPLKAPSPRRKGPDPRRPLRAVGAAAVALVRRPRSNS